MPDFNNWVSSGIDPMDEGQFAASTSKIIQRKPTEIILQRKGVNLAAQIFRLDFSNTEKEFDAATDATGSTRDVILLCLPDADIRRGDQFGLFGRLFRVTDTFPAVGKIEAHAEAIA